MGFSLKPNKPAHSGGSGHKIDFEAFNNHLEEQINTATENGQEPLVAVVSGLIDLGEQTLEDVEIELKDDNKHILDERDDAQVIDKAGKEYITYPSKPAQCFAVMIDFPDVMIDYGKFFSEDQESEFKPYRHLLNGEWYRRDLGSMVVNSPYKLRAAPPKSKNGIWTFAPNSVVSKLATACKVDDQVCTEDLDVGPLLGQFFMISLTAERNEKGYLNINAKNPSVKPKAIKAPEYKLEPFGITFDDGGDADELKQLRSSVKNTMQLALNWEGSTIQQQLDEAGLLFNKISKADKEAATEGEVNDENKKDEEAEAPEELSVDDFGDDAPF